MSASPPITNQPQASLLIDQGEFTLTVMVMVMVMVAIRMISVHFAPDVSNVAFPNQWP